MGMSSGGSSGVTHDINVTPMADIMLVLLIIFMITAPLIQSGVQINKARALNAREAPDLDKENVSTVTVTRDGLIFVNREAVPDDDDIPDALQECRDRAPDLPLFVRGDVAAPYGRIVQLINMARDVGYERIGMVVDRKEQALR